MSEETDGDKLKELIKVLALHINSGCEAPVPACPGIIAHATNMLGGFSRSKKPEIKEEPKKKEEEKKAEAPKEDKKEDPKADPNALAPPD